MFYIKVKELKVRTEFIQFMRGQEILTVFHYIPLHTAPAGMKFGRFFGDDVYTTKESERLVRLPLYYNMEGKDCETVVNAVKVFFGE